MSDKYYNLNDANLKIWQATVPTQCSGHPKYTLTADVGDYIIEFPFDAEGNHTGYPFQIPVPAHVVENNFTEVKPKASSKKTETA